MKLIIAEKPSLARNIVAGIDDKFTKKNGFFEGSNYIVTWAIGHLFSLADIETYSPNPDGSVKWSMNNIPCFPEKFQFEIKKDKNKQPDSGIKRQFEIIKSLCNRNDVETIVNAGDADREGEIIIRICVDKALDNAKPFKRLWLPDQTPQTIKTAIDSMEDENSYDNLAAEGYARTYIDWLYGVNLTRYATLKSGTLLRVGRVIVPIVKAIYDRDMSIRNFKPDIYYAIISKELTKDEEIELVSKLKFDKQKLKDAESVCENYNSVIWKVTGKKSKKDTLAPGKLYSLSKLQNVLGKKFKMSMDESLSIVQGLYEKGYVTYPRTNSEYLAEAEQGKVKTIIESIKKLGYPIEFKHKKTIFDDSKIESHSALTPTYKIPVKTELSDKEFMVYSTIMRRFVAVFCSEECTVAKTEITISSELEESFVLKGTVMLEPGWTKYDDYNKKDKILPALEKGDEVNVNFKPVEKETSPPKHYTIETLNNYLKNPFRDEKNAVENENDEEEYKAMFEGLELGTEATRTGIIDNAVKSRYIELKKDVYKILPDGEYLINSLQLLHISMDKYKTAEVGKALKKVYRGEFDISQSIEIARNEIKSIFEYQFTEDEDIGFFGDKVGVCPICGKDVARNKFGYGCTGYKDGCRFSVGSRICGKIISLNAVRILLEKGRSPQINGFVSKNGKNFSAALKIENDKVVFDFN
ncbi:MAG: topoisomerase C-terminal repeat-containing protein [Clostridia bacterium]|nr:topoisomerase C-terminal repeat-containing protein [Clostridia bacterium]